MICFTRKLLTNTLSRPALRDKSKYTIYDLRGIIAHWTANTDRGANAIANRNYFNLGLRYASAHYNVDDRGPVQCIPDNEVAYHVGATRYKPIGHRLKSGSNYSPNHFTIGFEMCVNKDGDWEATYEHSLRLAAFLLLKHGKTTDDLYRHFDVTGKDCPKMMIEEQPWNEFKSGVLLAIELIKSEITSRGVCTIEELNIRTGPGMEHPVVGQLYKGEPVMEFASEGIWIRIDGNSWVSSKYVDRIAV